MKSFFVVIVLEHTAEAQFLIFGILHIESTEDLSLGRVRGATFTSKSMGAFATTLSQASTSTFMEDRMTCTDTKLS